MEYVLRTFDVVKKYKNHYALNKVNMNVQKGDIYGFVGENGSGKTTIIRLICGLIAQNEGSFELFGVKYNSSDIHKVREKLGAIVESPSIYANMSAKDNLKMQSVLIGVNSEEKIKEVLEYVGLGELYDSPKKAGDFSLGMRQRLGIAMALIGEPEFIILDEPMNGLDPQGIVEIRELILKLNAEKGITFLISSHILTELALVATKYGIISKGRIIKEITAEELRNECRQSTEIKAENLRALTKAVEGKLDGYEITLVPNGIKIFGEIDLSSTLKLIIDAGVKITSVNSSSFSIEDYYLSIIGGVKND